MGTNNPKFKVREGNQAQKTPLLDQLLARGQVNLIKDNIDINEPGKALEHWDRADGVYNEIGAMIVKVGTEVNQARQAIVAVGQIQNPAELSLTINTVSSDLLALTEELVKIKERHAGLSGPVKNSEEQTLYLSVGTDYSILFERVKAITFPSMLTMTEHMGHASRVLRKAVDEEQAQLDAQNPNVITDVEVKETKND